MKFITATDETRASRLVILRLHSFITLLELWKKGDIISTPMSEYNTMDDVIVYYGWLRILMTAIIETNGVDPTACFSPAGFSLKVYSHSF
jgi:hypothetical protein